MEPRLVYCYANVVIVSSIVITSLKDDDLVHLVPGTLGYFLSVVKQIQSNISFSFYSPFNSHIKLIN